MQRHDVLGDETIPSLRVLIPYQKDQVETGQDGSLEVNVLAWRLQLSATVRLIQYR
jgi:hypothetical protein